MSESRQVRRWAAAGLLVALALTLAASWWNKSRCIDDASWTDGEQYYELCYTDYVALWAHRGLHVGAVPYFDEPLEYPVVLGGVLWATAAVARLGPGAATVRDYVDVNAGLMSVFVLLAVALIGRIGVALPWRAWWAAVPIVGLGVFINWDAVPVALLAAAIWSHQRGRDVASGAFVALGTAAKLYPAFLLPLVVFDRWREGRVEGAVRHVVTAAVTWVVLNVPVAVAAPEGWGRFLELNRERAAHVDSLWYALAWLGGPGLRGTTLNVVAAATFAIGAVAIVAVGLRYRPASPAWVWVAPVVAWFAVTNKVYSPQYSLWIVALLAVTCRRAAPFVAFALADVAVHLTEFAVLGGRSGFSPAPGEGWLVLATTVRAATVAWLIASLLRHPVSTGAPGPADEGRAAGAGPADRISPVGASRGSSG